MERDQQTQPDQAKANGSLSQQQIHVVGPDLRVEGSYESTKRRGVEDDFVIKCDGGKVRVHGNVLKGRIALFERELKVLKAVEQNRRRASTPTNEKRSDFEDWHLSWMRKITLVENHGGGQAAHRFETNGRAVIFHSKKSATIEGISLPIFDQIVEWAYTGSFRVPSEHVCDLLRAAAFFGIGRMKSKCEEYLTDKITEQNCLELCQFAELHTEPSGKLYKAVLKFIAENFSDLRLTDKFVQFNCVDSLQGLLVDDILNVTSEKEVFEFIDMWTNHDRATRSTHFDSLLSCVRFYQLSPRFLGDVVCKCDLITNSEEGRRRVEAVKDALFKFVCSRSNFFWSNDAPLGSLLGVNADNPRTQARADEIICVGGSNTNEANYLASIELFDTAQEKWRLATNGKRLLSERFVMGVVCLDKKLFVVGGFDKNKKSLSTVECLDLVTGEWSGLSPLRSARRGHALVALDGEWLYAIGGFNGLHLSSVERYDIARNEWSEMAPMSAGRWGVAAAVYHDQIYVVGGANCSALNSCERFDPIANRWTPIVPMLHKRFACGLAVVGDYLFAIGGNGVDGCCERYSFAENNWTEIKPLSTPRERLGVAVVGSRIYAIGGHELNGQALKTVEVYDTLTDEWASSASLNEPRYFHGVACSSSQFTRNL